MNGRNSILNSDNLLKYKMFKLYGVTRHTLYGVSKKSQYMKNIYI